MQLDCLNPMAALCEKVLTITVLLVVFVPSGALDFNQWSRHCGLRQPGIQITAPKNNEALSGSCLQIPCKFSLKDAQLDHSKPISGVWMRHDLDFAVNPNRIIFNSSNSANTYPLKITGNLHEENCTTLFPDVRKKHADKYFFRIENGPFKATGCKDHLYITVKDSPWSPSINIPVGDLKEHQSVTISCSAVTPCPHSPPELTWNLQQDSERQTEKNPDGTFTTKIQETITLSDTHDGYNMRCSARYPVNGGSKTSETEVTLSVSYAPRNTSASISPSGLVSAGSWVELSCSSKANPPANFTWFRNTKNGTKKVATSDFYSFRATEDGEYYCEATNDQGNQRSSILFLSVKDNAVFGLHITLKILGTILLCSAVVIFECWFRFSNKPKKEKEDQIYVNTVTETKP